MTEFDTDVPLPARARREKPNSIRSTLTRMDVGNSKFFADYGDNPKPTSISRTASLMNKGGKRTYAARIRTENGVEGVRVWRTA